MTRRSRSAVVATMVMRKRRQHPKLSAATINLATLHDAIVSEQISIMVDRSGEPGSCMRMLGYGVISVSANLSERARLLVLAHEYGHACLHFGDFRLARRRAEQLRWLSRRGLTHHATVAVQCELEADSFAAKLLGLTFAEYQVEASTIRSTASRAAA